MKKWCAYTICLCLLLTANVAKSQYYRQDQGLLLGINAGYTYPTGDMGKIVKNGIGGNISAKYLINRVIGIGFEAGYHSFQTKVLLSRDNSSQDEQSYKCKLIPALLEATFYIPTWDRTLLPYFGIHFGAYITNINVSQSTNTGIGNEEFSKKLYLFSPGGGVNAGVLYSLSDRIYLDLKIRADYIAKIDDEYDTGEYSEPGNIGFNKMLNIGANVGLLYRF